MVLLNLPEKYQTGGVSIGHSSVSYEQAMSCIDAGVASTTHTMNAMKLHVVRI